jgi:hypothetical protein
VIWIPPKSYALEPATLEVKEQGSCAESETRGGNGGTSRAALLGLWGSVREAGIRALGPETSKESVVCLSLLCGATSLSLYCDLNIGFLTV